MNKQDRLDQIRADILKQNICPDLAKTAKQLVMGEGDTDANLVFIGEAPGRLEDEKGKPFVGASGRFLDEFFAVIGLERSSVYITSIVKYRPPKNRDPTSDEKQAFLPFLYAQLKTIDPKVIVTLGRHSTNCFLPDLQISKIHGQSFEVESTAELPRLTVFPMYHPMVARYGEKKKAILLADYMKLQTILNKLNK